MLTTLPVLCFGALAPLAPALARRLGERTTAALALARHPLRSDRGAVPVGGAARDRSERVVPARADPDRAARGTITSTSSLSTLVQTVGYLIAAAAPLAIGAVHDVSGSWTPALIVLLALLVPQMILGLEAARNRTVTSARTAS